MSTQGLPALADDPRSVSGADAPPPRFCAAPWAEGVLRENGDLLACCRNLNVLGRWQQDGLQAAWHSAAYREFRGAIHAGRFPDDQCRKCYRNGTARTLANEVIGPFMRNREIVLQHAAAPLPALAGFESLFDLSSETPEARKRLEAFLRTLEACAEGFAAGGAFPAPVRLALRKLAVIAAVLESYWAGDPAPPLVAPYRQVGLQAQCNARCIQCIFLYSGEILHGAPLDPIWIDEAFSGAENIIDFFMFGSEFLFYPDWKVIADRLIENGVPLGISTNGIALTPDAIRHLIDRRIIHSLNISIDGATRETVEGIRVRVDFGDLLRQVDYLFDYANAKHYPFALNFSFILMRRNYRELPGLVRLIAAHLRGRALPVTYVLGTGLVPYPNDRYQRFFEREHHSLVPAADLLAMFREAQAASRETGLQVNCFQHQTLDHFMNAGCPVPTLDNRTALLAP